MEQRILVGTVGYPIAPGLFADDVDCIEMTGAKYIPPGRKTAVHERSGLPSPVECTVQVSRYFASPPPSEASLRGDIRAYGDFQVNDETRDLWKRQREYALALSARMLVLLTPPEITPSASRLAAMSSFLKEMDRDGIAIVWEPRGPWSAGQIRQFAQAHDLVVAVDPLRDAVPQGDVAYLRFGPFSSSGSRMGTYELEQIADAARSCDAATVYCVFDTHRAVDDARNLRRVLQEEPADDDFGY